MKKPVVLSVDASQKGLGAVLLQENLPTGICYAYASRALTDTETRYAQIKKEASAIVFSAIVKNFISTYIQKKYQLKVIINL